MSIIYTFEDNYFDQNETTTLVINPETLECDPKRVGPTTALIMCFILLVIFLLAIPGNFLVGWLIATSKQALTSSDVYLFHLTVADGLMALTLPFFAVAHVSGWIFGDFLCKVLSLISEANFYTSILFLACISIDRYLVIVRAHDVPRYGQRRCSRLLCAAVWALSWALALPALFYDAAKFSDDSEELICTESFDIGSSSVWRLVTRGLRHIYGFVVPLTVMVVCYTITITRLLHTRGFQKHRAMRVIIAVVIAFILCWMPYHITMVVDTLLRAKLIHYDCSMRGSVSLALHVTKSLALSHSCINPFLYAFVGKKFRHRMTLFVQRNLLQERLSGSRFSRSASLTSEGSGTVF